MFENGFYPTLRKFLSCADLNGFFNFQEKKRKSLDILHLPFKLRNFRFIIISLQL